MSTAPATSATPPSSRAARSTTPTSGPRPAARASEWLLTARHAERLFDGRRSAWGAFHIRRNGEHRTACGQPTMMWHTFWELRMDTLLARVCRDCAAAARAAAPR